MTNERTDDRTDGLNISRGPVAAPIELQEPRVPAWHDLIAAERRRLRPGGGDSTQTGQARALALLKTANQKAASVRPPKTKSGAPAANPEHHEIVTPPRDAATPHPSTPPAAAAGAASPAAVAAALTAAFENWTATDPTAHAYLYTRAPETTNDQMGYGERVVEELWFVEDGRIVPRLRTSQRTKSGRQVLVQGEKPPTR
jgi:hypothetical protein